MTYFSEISIFQYQHFLQVKNINAKMHVFDPIRKKFVVLLPEELVRQCLIQAILQNNIYPKNLIQIEKTILVNGRKRRFDIVIYTNQVHPFLLIECKSPSIALDQIHADQIFAYNSTLSASYILITNGQSFYCGSIDLRTKRLELINHFPLFSRKDK